jgi:flagellar hook-associated protein 1 FlgK
MGGMGLVFNIAKDALVAQRYSMDVTAHNIANVDTPGYSKQDPVIAARTSTPVNGLNFGTGADLEAITRNSDQLLENRLMKQKSSLLSSQEMASYLRVLEGVFNENTETSISALLSDFWNQWHEISINPDGPPERMALYEQGNLLSEQFMLLDQEMSQMVVDLTKSVNAGIGKVNQIAAEIAETNNKITGLELDHPAADIRDKRNALVSELSGYLDITTFEQSNGTLTVVSAKGAILVQDDLSYDLEMGGVDGDRVMWQSSGSTTIDITDHITNGSINGWLDMRDEVIAETRLDLDAMVKELVWIVNEQHSQGVGVKLFEPGMTLTGSYQTNTDLGDLPFGDRIQFVANAFELWIEDRTVPGNPVIANVTIDLNALNGNSTLADLANAINAQIAGAGLAGVTADGSGTSLELTANNNTAFGFSDDVSGILAALGVNTFFKGFGSGTIGMNDTLTDNEYIAAGMIDGVGNYVEGDNANALAIADLQFTSTPIEQWTVDRANGNTVVNVTSTIEEYYHSLVGAIGITSSSVSRGMVFEEEMVSSLQEMRDAISAVSLDEEMTNLIKYQHAYASAAKLITAADEMLQTLLDMK